MPPGSTAAPDRDAARARARHFMLTRAIAPQHVAQPKGRGSGPNKSNEEYSPQLLPLLTFPWQLPRDAAGLSLYFTTVASIIVLMFTFSLISAIPLAENLSAFNFSKRYLLVDPTIPDELVDQSIQDELRGLGLPDGFARGSDPDSTATQEFVLSDEVGEVNPTISSDIIKGIECEQTYSGYPNIWTNMTVGHFCSNSDFSSPFECPGACVFNAAKLNDPNHPMYEKCQGTRGERGAKWWATNTTEELCAARMPCYEWEFNDTSLSQCLNVVQTKPIPSTQMWLWGVAMVSVYMIWLLGLRLWLVRVSQSLERATPSMSSFAVVLSGPGIKEASDAAVANFARHYGNVVQVMRPVEAGRAFALASQILQKQIVQEELKMMAEGVEPPPPRSCFRKIPLAEFAYRRLQALHQTPAAAAKSTEEAIIKVRESLAKEEQRPLRPSIDACVVVFNYVSHAMNAYRDLSQSTWQYITGSCSDPKGPLLSDAGNKRTTVHDFPEPPDAGASGGKVVAARAPEPSDFWWDNMKTTANRARMHSAAVWGLCIIAMVISGAIVLELAKLSEETRQEREYCDEEVRDENGFLPKSCCTADTLENGNCVEAPVRYPVLTMRRLRHVSKRWGTERFMQSLTRDLGRNMGRQAVLSQLSGLTITAVNSLVTMLLINITPLERRVQHSTALGSTTTKLTMFYLVNSVVIPIVAVYLTSNSDESWYIPGGIAQEAFYIQLFNIFLPNIIALLNFPHPLFSLVFSHHARTQPMVDQLMHPPPFLLPLRVANIVRTVALSVLYMPVLPVSVILGTFASLASYLVDHFLVFRLCAKPPEFGIAAFSSAFYYLRVLPVLWLLLMQFVFFPGNKFEETQSPPVTWPFILGLLIWGVASLLPLQSWLGLDDRQIKKNKPKSAKNFSYLSLFQTAAEASSSRTVSFRQAGNMHTDAAVQYTPASYGPVVPAECSNTFRGSIQELYKIYNPPLQENMKLLRGQDVENGAQNARPPAPDMIHAAPPKVQAMFVKPVPPERGGPHGLHFTAVPAFDTTGAFSMFT